MVLAVSFPLLGRIGDFHPLETCAARRTQKGSCPYFRQLPFHFVKDNLLSLSYIQSYFRTCFSNFDLYDSFSFFQCFHFDRNFTGFFRDLLYFNLLSGYFYSIGCYFFRILCGNLNDNFCCFSFFRIDFFLCCHNFRLAEFVQKDLLWTVSREILEFA